MRRMVLLTVVGLVFAGCSAEAEVGGSGDGDDAKPVPASTIERRGEQALSDDLGAKVQLECDDPLPAKRAAKVYCTGTAEGHDVEQDVRVQVTGVEDGDVAYDIEMLQLAPGPEMAKSVKQALVGAGAPQSMAVTCPKLQTIEDGRSFECDVTGIEEDSVTVTFTDDEGP